MATTIPEELLEQMFSYLLSDLQWQTEQRHAAGTVELRIWVKDAIISRATLRNLCRVSKTFGRIAQPLMFHTFRRLDYGDDTRPHTRESRANMQTKLFLRTLLETPNGSKLADGVKHISLGCWTTCGNGSSIIAPPPQDLLALYRTDLPQPMGSADGLFEELARGNANCEIVLLMGLCKNIESMDYLPFNFREGRSLRFLNWPWSNPSEQAQHSSMFPKMLQTRVQDLGDISASNFGTPKGHRGCRIVQVFTKHPSVFWSQSGQNALILNVDLSDL